MSMQPLILPFKGAVPRIHESAWIAPNATIIGDVVIGPDSSVFYGCVLRGDVGPIRIGARTNIQDNSTVHVDGDAPCTIGDDVTVGHMALLHGTTVHDGTLVGMKAALLSQWWGRGRSLPLARLCWSTRRFRQSPWPQVFPRRFAES